VIDASRCPVILGSIDLTQSDGCTLERLQEQATGGEEMKESQLDRVLCRFAGEPKHLQRLSGVYRISGLVARIWYRFNSRSNTTDWYGNLEVLAKQFASNLFSEAQQQSGCFGTE
jgi:hypothetical protein